MRRSPTWCRSRVSRLGLPIICRPDNARPKRLIVPPEASSLEPTLRLDAVASRATARRRIEHHLSQLASAGASHKSRRTHNTRDKRFGGSSSSRGLGEWDHHGTHSWATRSTRKRNLLLNWDRVRNWIGAAALSAQGSRPSTTERYDNDLSPSVNPRCLVLGSGVGSGHGAARN